MKAEGGSLSTLEDYRPASLASSNGKCARLIPHGSMTNMAKWCNW